MASPATTSSPMRAARDIAALERLLIQKINGVSAAHSHASTNGRTSGPVRVITRSPSLRGS